MLIARIEGANRVLGAPPNWNEERDGLCGALPILARMEGANPVMISAWQPTPPELEALNDGASVYLKVVGATHPPVMIWAEPNRGADDHAPSARHNETAPTVFRAIIQASETEAQAMVMLESVILGVLLYYRPDPSQAAEFLDAVTRGALERMQP